MNARSLQTPCRLTALAVGLAASLVATAAQPDSPTHVGQITGTVVRADTKQPIPGAYVGTGLFGDAGGSNLARFEAEGLYSHTKTDAQGRFTLKNLTLADHPLIVTHPQFVRDDRTVAAKSEPSAPPLRIELQPASTIRVTVVDANGAPVVGPYKICLSALDGHAFLPPEADPHLDAFRSPVHAQPSRGTTAFGALTPGEYSIDVFQSVPRPVRKPQAPRPTETVYYGGLDRVHVAPGQTRELHIKPAHHDTTVTLAIPPVLKPSTPARLRWEIVTPMVLISRNTGLPVWSDTRLHGVEDSRLGRLMTQALMHHYVAPGGPHQLRNLPPGKYAVFVGPPVALQGELVAVESGHATTADVSWTTPSPPDDAAPLWWQFNQQVDLVAKDYTGQELCRLLTAAVGSRLTFEADPAIADTQVQLPPSKMSIWEIVESLYRNQRWRIDDRGGTTIRFRPRIPPAAGTTPAATPNENSQKTPLRVGTYDSRCIVVAYAGSPRHEAQIHRLDDALAEAKKSGDAEAIKEADRAIWESRMLTHRQAFGDWPVDDVLQQFPEAIDRVKEDANVDILVSKWDKTALAKHKNAEKIDVTLRLVDAMKPKPRQRVFVLNMLEKATPPLGPKPLEKALRAEAGRHYLPPPPQKSAP